MEKENFINVNATREIKYRKPIIEFINETVQRKKLRHRPAYEKNYGNLIYHLNKFSEIYDAELFVESINERMLDYFIAYMESENCRLGYIANIVCHLKAMVAKAGRYGYCVDSTYDDVVVKPEETYAVYLTMTDIVRMYYFKGLSRIQEINKDFFLMGCLTGLRYSDMITLCPEDYKGDHIIKRTQKTNTDAIIPVHDLLKELLIKYDYKAPKVITNQQFNRAVKLICKKVGIDDPISYSFHKGGKLISVTKPKYELVSIHTARRSMLTNMYLSGCYSMYQIMLCSTHTSEKCLLRYLKVDKAEMGKQMASASFCRK